MRVLLSLDLSTTCTGWAKFDMDTGALLEYGAIKPEPVSKRKGFIQYLYPVAHVIKFRKLADQITALIDVQVEAIVIEEINRGKNRLGQKVLDGFHFVLLDKLPLDVLQKVRYIDSDGLDGWRSANGLRLQLSGVDKLQNKNTKAYNKKFGKKNKAKELITQKTLAVRFVNKQFGLQLDLNEDSSHGDIADAVGLGYHAIREKKYNNAG